MNIHLFGSTSPVGLSYLKILETSGTYKNIFRYSHIKKNLNFFDLCDSDNCELLEKESPSIVISFAPIWLFAKFLNDTFNNNSDIFSNVKGFIVCSSSSSLTKKFSTNKFDINLSKKLVDSEQQIIKISRDLDKKCIILQPSLIYGTIFGKRDKNISKIIKTLRIFPFILLPKDTGLRQPIHISQLAKVFFHYTKEISMNSISKYYSSMQLIGGDQEISYYKMIETLKKKLNKKGIKIRCILITIPNRLFLFLLSPLIIFSPKWFSAIERLSADLSKFKKVHEITKEEIQPFPVEPYY